MLDSTKTLTTNEAAAAGAVMGGMFGTLIVAGIAVAIISIIAMWKIFTKAGEKGWKSLIPIYNVYILFKISGFKAGFWCYILAQIIAVVITSVGISTGGLVTDEAGNITEVKNAVFAAVPAVLSIVEIVIGIMGCYKLAKAFKRGIGTTIGLIFLPFIFSLILAFGSAKYDKKVLKK